MQCYHPIHVRSPNGVVNTVSCGKCFACQSNRRKDFAFRLKEEQKHSLVSYTVTLSYDDYHLPPLEIFYIDNPLSCDDPDHFYYNPLRIDDVQRFIKVLRKHYKLRYFGVGEYGARSNRPHYHIIFFFKDAVRFKDFEVLVHKKWLYGSQVYVDVTNDAAIEYTLKYCLKPYNNIGPSPKIICSKNPFIGYSYFTWDRLQFHMHHPGDMTSQEGIKKRLPRIYRRIYTDNMKVENQNLLNDMLEDKFIKDNEEAESKGISYEELQSLRIEEHKKKVIKQIKKRSL